MKRGTGERVSRYFDEAAHTFDGFYDQKRTRVMQLVDQRFRSDMFERFRLTFEALEPLVERTVLDIGCGSGPYAVEAARRGAAMVLGLDVAPTMLDLARQRVAAAGQTDRCRFELARFPDQAPDEPSDYAIVIGVMDYVDEPLAFLTRLREVTRHRAVLSFPSKHWFRTPLRRVRYVVKRCPVYFFDERHIRELMTAAGFQGVTVEKIRGAGMDFVAVGRTATA